MTIKGRPQGGGRLDSLNVWRITGAGELAKEQGCVFLGVFYKK
jgi:hypothetical protein